MAVGSQAERGNKLTILRMSDLGRMPREKTEKELDDEMLGEEWDNRDDDEDGDEGSSSSEEEEEELDPILEHYTFPHEGGINRIRACPQNNDVVAVWGEKGTVSLYDVGGALDLLDRSTMSKSESVSNYHVRKMRKDPFFVYEGHSTEGYALDWSRVVPGRLATADCDGHIHIWNAMHAVAAKEITSKSSPWGNSSFEVKPTYSPSGDNIDTPSVEDLQWSPNEATVLASAECGGYVRIYDVRCPNRAMISNKIHGSGADVNVISWNRLVSNLLASGGDDGEFLFHVLNVHPLRSIELTVSPIADLIKQTQDHSASGIYATSKHKTNPNNPNLSPDSTVTELPSPHSNGTPLMNQ